MRFVATSNSSLIMNQSIPVKSQSLQFRKLQSSFRPWSRCALLILACCTLLPAAQAVTPAPDGGYPGNNTAEGDNALLSLTNGTDNTAVGFDALYSTKTGLYNTALRSDALLRHVGGSNDTTTW